MLFCNFCPGNPKVATVACESCSYYYCSACLKKFHPKAGPLKSHNIIKASSLKPEESYCADHDGEKFCIFCASCSRLLCLKCVADHASHELSNIDKAVNISKENLIELSARLDKHLVRASRVKQETERQIAELKREERCSERKIKTECEFLRNTINGCEKNMLHAINEQIREQTHFLQHALDEIPKLSTGSMRVLNDLSGVLQQKSSTHLLARYGELKSRAESQLKILDALNKPAAARLTFDPKTFDCSAEVNMLADKLTVATPDNPHVYDFVGMPGASHTDSKQDITSSEMTQSVARSGDGFFITPPQRGSSVDGRSTMTMITALERSQALTRLTYPQTFINKCISKHPEFLQQSVSLDTLLRKGEARRAEDQLRDIESNIQLPTLIDEQKGDDLQEDDSQAIDYVQEENNNNAVDYAESTYQGSISEHLDERRQLSPDLLVKKNSLTKLEDILKSFSKECQIDELLTDSPGVREPIRFLTEEAIPTTSHGAKQRAREGYYACYRLTSEREQDEEFQAKLNSCEVEDLRESRTADQQIITDINEMESCM